MDPIDETKDVVRVNDLLLLVSLATGAHWPPKGLESTPQPVYLSISIPYDAKSTAVTDTLSDHSLDYSELSNRLRGACNSQDFSSLQRLAIWLYQSLFHDETVPKTGVRMSITQPSAPPHCKEIGIAMVSSISPESIWGFSCIKYTITGFSCPAIIGINAVERSNKQDVIVKISIEANSVDVSLVDWVDFRAITESLYEDLSKTNYLTLEAFASFVAFKTLSTLWEPFKKTALVSMPVVIVGATKPSALVFASSAEIEVSRTFADFANVFKDNPSYISMDGGDMHPSTSTHNVAVALGSNLGDRFHNIEYALRLLETPSILASESGYHVYDNHVVTVVDTSFLYETAPMYLTDQPAFLNCACLVETNIQPVMFLALLKTIEKMVGRIPSVRNGPRAVDLDLILYDDLVLDTREPSCRKDLENLRGELVIPHPRIAEREFVLRPLNDIISTRVHPVYKKSISSLLSELTVSENEPPMQKVIPFPKYPIPESISSVTSVPPTLVHWCYSPSFKSNLRKKRQTRVMATLNATPDSFSDGSKHNTIETGLKYVCDSVVAGANIVDIGGYSTRPGAAFVDAETEMQRVVPMVQAIRGREAYPPDSPEVFVREIPISVDTFRWEVAEASIKAGANCINDVYAFTGQDSYNIDDLDAKARAQHCMAQMKQVARDLAVPVVLMHSRGDAGQNKDYSMYSYTRDIVVEGVRVELGEKVDRIVKGKGGVRRWFVIIDPGIGFSKSLEGNLELLRQGADIVNHVQIGQGNNRRMNPLSGYPMLIGASRKSFLGAILAQGENGRQTEPEDRVWATAATVTCAVQQCATVVRVHDIPNMVDVVRVADALWS